MSTRGINPNASPRQVLAIIVSSLSVVTSLALTANPAPAAPPEKKTTTTTTAPTSGGGGGGTQSGPSPKLTAVAALSRHRALATYDRDLDPAALQVSTYAFYSTQAVNLPVTAVSKATNNQVFITTGPQEPVTYEVKQPKTPRPITFTGSTVGEPKLLSAKPVSNTQIILTFSEPMGAAALQPSSYQITVQGSTTTLAVNSVTLFGSTQKEVLLTTAPQQAVNYGLKVGDIQGASGTYIDPTATTVQLSGSTVPPGPMLLNATSGGDTSVVLTFDAPLASSATDSTLYTGTPNLFIQSAALQSENRQVVLTTSGQYQIDYSIDVNVTGADGNPVNPAFKSFSFKGSGAAISTERPKVVSAASTGNKSVTVQFSKPMADSTANSSRFAIVQTTVHPEVGTLAVSAAEFVDGARLSVRLTTSSQAEVTYQVTANNVTDLMGNPLADKTNVAGVVVDPTSFIFPGTPPTECPGNPPPGTVATNGTTLTGTGTTFKTTFKVGDTVRVAGETDRTISEIASDTRLTVSTAFSSSGSGFIYRVSCPDEPVNSDGDTLYDHEETRGWTVTISLANGETQVRQITSSPFNHDTDADGLTDDVERSLNIDPRDTDTDDDGLVDYAEFNEIYSDPTVQDTDGDGLYDGLEVNFFRTSAILNDTDGDQLLDGVEINLSNRNPRVADLPKPSLEIGSMSLGLDVRFVDTVGGEDTVVDSKTAIATLVQSDKKEFSNSDTATVEAGMKVGHKEELGLEVGSKGFHVAASFETSVESSYSGSYTANFTDTSTAETINSYEKSLTTTAQRTESASQSREIAAARMNLNVMLKSAGDIAFTIKNLQVTAHVQDPQNPDRLTPIGTLVPENEPDAGYNLGPLVPVRGPIVFKTDTLFPLLVEDLMLNPRGVVFRFANFDVTDEKGRNFAFTSQDVNDRTARLVIDYGSFDRDGDGQGDLSEIFRVAAGTGRRTVDTNGDGLIDASDRVMVFDPNGKHLGISLREALQATGLTEYKETEDPTNSLTQAQIDNSYSVIDVPELGERVFRVRRQQNGVAGERKGWQIITPTGIDPTLGLDDIVMTAGQSVSFAFVQDLDKDNLIGTVERINGCSDASQDSDSDGLDDRFEVMIGWTVDTDLGQSEARSRCVSKDTDNDGLLDGEESPAVIEKRDGLVRFDPGHGPRRRLATTFKVATVSEMVAIPACSPTVTTGCASPGDLANRPDGLYILTNNQPSLLASWVRLSSDLAGADEAAKLVREKLADPVTDPSNKDTDGDGLEDKHEATPHEVKLHGGSLSPLLITSAELFDTDLDTASDGLEERVGGDPTVRDLENFVDSDGDGLTNTEERQGWTVALEAESTLPARCDSACAGGVKSSRPVTSDPNIADTDGDGLNDGQEKNAVRPERFGSAGIDPRSKDTDNDGLTDFEEVKGFTLGTFGILVTDPGDADTDDDKRKDGAEVKQPITVRVVGESPRQVVSNPTVADADWDRLVDGDEALAGRPWKGTWSSTTAYVIDDVVSHLGTSYVAIAPSKDSAPPSEKWVLLSSKSGTDPNNHNTDGDNRSDFDEFGLKRNPLLPDLSVKVNFSRLNVTKDGEKEANGDTGDFQFAFDVVGPGGTTQAVRWVNGTSPNFSSTVAPKCDFDKLHTLCWADYEHEGQHYPVIHIVDGQTLVFPNGGVTVDTGSVSTTDMQPEDVRVSGYLYERDGTKHDLMDCEVNLPDPFGTAADGTGIVRGTDLQAGITAFSFHRKFNCPRDGSELDFTLMMSYTAT